MTKRKVAIITGASKGIGRAITIGLAKMNYQCILIGRNKKDLMQVSVQISKSNNYLPKVIPVDITNSSDLKIAIANVISEFKQIDVLVNNAGIYENGTLGISADNFTKMLDTNLLAQYSVLKEVVRQMKRQKSGYIFNLASRAGKIGFAGSGAYSASKFALVGLNESLYRELNPLGIRVTALCPGWVNTKMAYKAGTTLDPEQMIQPDDVFKTIQWLLSLSPGACVKEVVLETPYNIS